MKVFDKGFWVRAAVMTAVVSAGVFVTVRYASAVPGGETRPALSFAGTLTGTTGTQTLTFTFKKGTTTVCSPTAMVTPSAGSGAFNTEVPLSGCPSTLFDGSDVTFDVSVGSTVLARDQAVNPVPYARYADRVGTPDCPTGYDRDATATGITLCRRALAGGAFDEVVKVGTGASAFWIDRYEASVWPNADGSGTQYTADYPAGLPRNGQWRTAGISRSPAFALSRSAVGASISISWFQAQEACAASGKRLPSREEWLRAVNGTPDPGANDGAATGNARCNTQSAAGRRNTGGGSECISGWGAQDMIGNVWEWTDEWYAGVGASSAFTNSGVARWPEGFGGDGTWNVAAWVDRGDTELSGLPSAAVRGGHYNSGSLGGVSALSLYYAPSYAFVFVGFRCVIPR